MNQPVLQRLTGYLQSTNFGPHRSNERHFSVTISREAGAGASTVASLLAGYLESHSEGTSPWAIFDKELIELVLREHGLGPEMSTYIVEDRIPLLKDAIEDILGLHPPGSTLVAQVEHTISRLARRGNAIIIGRAANFITSDFMNTLHVRLVAPMEERVRHLASVKNLLEPEAKKLVDSLDAARSRHVRQNYASDVADPLNYHMVLNTTALGFQNAAEVIGGAVLKQQALHGVGLSSVP